MEGKQITSFDSNKVWKHEENGQKSIFKRTVYAELENLLKAKEFLKSKGIIIGGKKYSINVPEIISWNKDSHILNMTFCSGENMELLLRDNTKRNQYIKIFQSIFMFMFRNNFYWEDFAPRNILIQGNHISLVDFEKGLHLHDVDLRQFLRQHVYEEYSSFLLEKERLLNPSLVFSATEIEKKEQISIDSIEVKRIQTIAKLLGCPSFITRQQYLNIQLLIIKAETPYYIDNHLFFPRVKLEELLQDRQTNPMAYIDYATEIIRLSKDKSISDDITI